METRFDPFFVALSIVVAIFASYVALNLAHSVTTAKGRARAIWLGSGALAMGVGIWSMHFIGMLAFEMPGMTMAYDIPLMVLSVVVAIGGSALALYTVSREVVPPGSFFSAGIAMAAAIAGMHYIGMYSMRMPARMVWNAYLVVASVVIALVASIGALVILNRLRAKTDRLGPMLGAATVMGLAVAGMHYTGMFAATFVHAPEARVTSAHLLVSAGLELAVVLTPLFILALALIGSIAQRRIDQRDESTSAILDQSEERFRHLVEAVKDYAIFMLDPTGRITTWNPGAERITGYEESEILGRHISLLMTAKDREADVATRELETAAAAGHYEGEGQRVRKDGTVYWASLVIAPLVDAAGHLKGFSKVLRDITAMREAEWRLRQLNEELEARVQARTRTLEEREFQLQTIADAVPVLIARLDRDERFLFANGAFCRWFQRSDSEVLGHTFRKIVGEAAYPFNRPFLEKALAGNVAHYERESQSGDYSAILDVTLVPEFDPAGQVAGFVVVASDITSHKAIQEELKQAKEAAEVANATKSAFLANMSHEIRTPLGAVLGFSELLFSGDLIAEDRQNAIEAIKRNGRLLSNVINDILDISKVEAGKLEIERLDVPFPEVMKEIGSVLSLEASERGIDLKVTAEGPIPKTIKTDPLRLRQILLNIVGNAIKFTRRGRVTVTVKLVRGARGTPHVAFVVSDTGEGISKEQAARLFTPFTQADASTTRRFGGTGLGLVLSRRLANALGGDVRLTASEPGKGSTFVVTIDPGVPSEVLFESAAAEQPAPRASLPAASKGPSLAPLKILVADDSGDNQVLIRKILTRSGATVETASNGREAVVKATTEPGTPFSLILMDLQMPEMDGYEATRELRRLGFRQPIIALTAHAMKEERERTKANGFDDHLTKPIERQALVEAVASYLP